MLFIHILQYYTYVNYKGLYTILSLATTRSGARRRRAKEQLLVNIKILCPTCEKSDLVDNGSEASCVLCKTTVYLSSTYDALRVTIDQFRFEHIEQFANWRSGMKMALTTNLSWSVNVGSNVPLLIYEKAKCDYFWYFIVFMDQV